MNVIKKETTAVHKYEETSPLHKKTVKFKETYCIHNRKCHCALSW